MKKEINDEKMNDKAVNTDKAINDDVIEPDVSLLARLLDAENDENIFLFDENGEEIELEQIATITHEGAIYTILHPMTAEEDEVVVFKIDPKDEESVNIVDDEVLAEKILDLYHQQSETSNDEPGQPV